MAYFTSPPLLSKSASISWMMCFPSEVKKEFLEEVNFNSIDKKYVPLDSGRTTIVISKTVNVDVKITLIPG